MSIPAEVEELFDDANGDLAMGELEAAVEKYRSCVHQAPEFFDGWHALALALVKLDRAEEALDAGKRAIAINPNDQLVWTAMSQIHVKLGQIKEAEDAKAKARIAGWGGRIDVMEQRAREAGERPE